MATGLGKTLLAVLDTERFAAEIGRRPRMVLASSASIVYAAQEVSMRSSILQFLVLLLPLSGCYADLGVDAEDGPDDTFLGAADASGVADHTPTACAVLKLTNLGSVETLDGVVGLSSQTADAIYAYRLGPDRLAGTDDDRWIRDLAELDRVRWVGPAAFRRLRAYTASTGYSCETVGVQVLAFNDFHGNLQPPTGSSGRIVTGANPATDRVDAGGAEFLATHLARLAATNPNTLIVSAGDVVGATPLLSALFHDEPTIESMNLVGLDVASVGNHEFDEGPVELLRLQRGGCHPVDGCQDGDPFAGASFDYLAANVIENASGETLLPSWTERRFGAARIAIIGLTLEGTPNFTTAAGVVGLTFLDEAETINALVPEIQAEGIDTIIVLIHEGGEVTGLYNECVGISGPLFEITRNLHPAIDVVVAGHTNAAHICDLDGRLVTSAAHAGRLITDIDLRIDEVTGEVVSRTAANVIVTRDVTRDAAQTALISKYVTLSAPLANRVIGSVSADLLRVVNAAGESTLGDVLADSQLAGTSSQETGGAVAAFMNPGGIRADIIASQISGGEQANQVTYGEAFAVQPFGNNLITLTLTGREVELLLEQQWSMVAGSEQQTILAPSAGVSYAWDPARPIGDRIDAATIRIGGAPLDFSARYRITVNIFLAGGGDGFTVLRNGTDRRSGPGDLEPLAAYLTAYAPVGPPALDRITRRAP